MITQILTAAIQMPNGVILSLPRPNRHHDILNNSHVHRQCQGKEVQGFLAMDDDVLVFLNREEALAAAKRLNLVPGKCNALFSENLW